MAESVDVDAIVDKVMVSPRILTVGDVAAVLRLSVAATKRIPPAELPYSRVGSRGDRRYEAKDVEAYLVARRVSS
jgi:hypothetical protein